MPGTGLFDDLRPKSTGLFDDLKAKATPKGQPASVPGVGVALAATHAPPIAPAKRAGQVVKSVATPRAEILRPDDPQVRAVNLIAGAGRASRTEGPLLSGARLLGQLFLNQKAQDIDHLRENVNVGASAADKLIREKVGHITPEMADAAAELLTRDPFTRGIYSRAIQNSDPTQIPAFVAGLTAKGGAHAMANDVADTWERAKQGDTEAIQDIAGLVLPFFVAPMLHSMRPSVEVNLPSGKRVSVLHGAPESLLQPSKGADARALGVERPSVEGRPIKEILQDASRRVIHGGPAAAAARAIAELDKKGFAPEGPKVVGAEPEPRITTVTGTEPIPKGRRAPSVGIFDDLKPAAPDDSLRIVTLAAEHAEPSKGAPAAEPESFIQKAEKVARLFGEHDASPDFFRRILGEQAPGVDLDTAARAHGYQGIEDLYEQHRYGDDPFAGPEPLPAEDRTGWPEFRQDHERRPPMGGKWLVMTEPPFTDVLPTETHPLNMEGFMPLQTYGGKTSLWVAPDEPWVRAAIHRTGAIVDETATLNYNRFAHEPNTFVGARRDIDWHNPERQLPPSSQKSAARGELPPQGGTPHTAERPKGRSPESPSIVAEPKNEYTVRGTKGGKTYDVVDPEGIVVERHGDSKKAWQAYRDLELGKREPNPDLMPESRRAQRVQQLLDVPEGDPRLDPFADEFDQRLEYRIKTELGDGVDDPRPAHEILTDTKNEMWGRELAATVAAESEHSLAKELAPLARLSGKGSNLVPWVKRKGRWYPVMMESARVGVINVDSLPEWVVDSIMDYARSGYADPDYVVLPYDKTLALKTAKGVGGRLTHPEGGLRLTELAEKDAGSKKHVIPLDIIRKYYNRLDNDLYAAEHAAKKAAENLGLSDEEFEAARKHYREAFDPGFQRDRSPSESRGQNARSGADARSDGRGAGQEAQEVEPGSNLFGEKPPPEQPKGQAKAKAEPKEPEKPVGTVKGAAARARLEAEAKAAAGRLKRGGYAGWKRDQDLGAIAAKYLLEEEGVASKAADRLKADYGLDGTEAAKALRRARHFPAVERVEDAIRGGAKFADVDEALSGEFKNPADRKEIFARAKENVTSEKLYWRATSRGPVPMMGRGGTTIPLSWMEDAHHWSDTRLHGWKGELRIVEQVIGEGTKEAQRLQQWLIEDRARAVTSMTVERENWGKNIREALPIVSRSKNLSALVMQFGEGRISLEELKAIAPKHWQAVVDADKWFRKQYDGLLARNNEIRRQFGYKPIPYRQDYYTHFREESLKARLLGKDAPLKGSSLQDLARPAKGWNPYENPREGDLPFKDDAVRAFEAYLGPTLRDIYLTESAVRRRTLVDALRTTSLKGKLQDFIKALDKHADELIGREQMLDRAMGQTLLDTKTKRQIQAATEWVAHRTGANTILGNIGSTVMQTAQLAPAIAEAGVFRVARGLLDEIAAGFGQGVSADRLSPFLRRRYAETGTVRPSITEKGARGLAWVMNLVEQNATEAVWRSVYRKGLDMGLRDVEAVAYADRWTEKIVAGRSIGEQPLVFQTFTGRTALQFQLEVNNFVNFALKDAYKNLTPGQKFVKAAKIMLALYGFNKVYELVMGRNPLPDPIQTAIDVYDIAAGRADQKGKRIGGRILGEALSSVAGGQTLAGLIPENVGGIRRKDLLGRTEAGLYGGGIPLSDAILGVGSDPVRTLFSVAPPYGGRQALKSWRGFQAIRHGGVLDPNAKKEYDAAGNLVKGYKYTIDTLPDKVRAILFGPSATSGARKTYEAEAEPPFRVTLSPESGGVVADLRYKIDPPDRRKGESEEAYARRVGEFGDRADAVIKEVSALPGFKAMSDQEKQRRLQRAIETVREDPGKLNIKGDAAKYLRSVDYLPGAPKKLTGESQADYEARLRFVEREVERAAVRASQNGKLGAVRPEMRKLVLEEIFKNARLKGTSDYLKSKRGGSGKPVGILPPKAPVAMRTPESVIIDRLLRGGLALLPKGA
jgi:hypothetical protein